MDKEAVKDAGGGEEVADGLPVNKGGVLMPRKARAAPFDHGWAWLIVVACFFVNFLTIGVAKSMGVLFVEFQEKFATTSGVTSWLLGLHAALGMLLSPFTSALALRFNNRIVVMAGGLLLALGYLLSAFATDIRFLFVSYGFIGGVGYACSFAPTVVMVSFYFRKRRATANGISFAGNAIGNFCLPHLLRVMTETFALFGTQLVLSGLVLHVLLCGALLRPLTFYTRTRKKMKFQSDVTSSLQKHPLRENPSNKDLPEYSRDNQVEYELEKMLDNASVSDTKKRRSSNRGCCFGNMVDKICFLPSKLGEDRRPIFDYTLLKNKLFLVFLCAIFLSSAGYPVVFMVLPPYAKEMGFKKSDGALIVSVIGICDLLGRIILGIVADLRFVKKIYMFLGTMALAGCVCVALGLIQNLPVLATLCGMYGFLGGSFMSLTPVILVESLGQERLTRAYGFSTMSQGVAFLITMPLAGVIKDLFGHWNIALFASGGLTLAGALVLLLRPLAERSEKKRESAGYQDKGEITVKA